MLFQRRISLLNQRGYDVDRRRDVISTYFNVESTLSVCWVKSLSIRTAISIAICNYCSDTDNDS